MNPYLISILGTLFHMKRVCPQCKREQFVPLKERGKTAKCRYCGAEMPEGRGRNGKEER